MMLKFMRATELWQKTGAFYVRIQAMAKKYHITLRDEFDEYDESEDTRYIVVLDEDFPVATCRFYELDQTSAMIGRLVVLPEYRGGLGRQVMEEAETWLRDLGYSKAVLESRKEIVDYYASMGYRVVDESIIHGVTFECVRMEKQL